MRKAFLRAIALVALLLVAGGAVLIYTPWGRSLWQLSADELTGTALIGGPFQLKDQNGTVRRDADFRGQYLLVFFGYSNCPDTCPIVLQHMTEALDKLGPKAEK